MGLLKKRPASPIDLNRIAAVAVEAFLEGSDRSQNDARSHNGSQPTRRHGLGAAGALATGVVLAAAARAAYVRVRGLDLEQVAHAVEQRLKD
jgi:hypothetical protein